MYFTKIREKKLKKKMMGNIYKPLTGIFEGLKTKVPRTQSFKEKYSFTTGIHVYVLYRMYRYVC